MCLLFNQRHINVYNWLKKCLSMNSRQHFTRVKWLPVISGQIRIFCTHSYTYAIPSFLLLQLQLSIEQLEHMLEHLYIRCAVVSSGDPKIFEVRDWIDCEPLQCIQPEQKETRNSTSSQSEQNREYFGDALLKIDRWRWEHSCQCNVLTNDRIGPSNDYYCEPDKYEKNIQCLLTIQFS